MLSYKQDLGVLILVQHYAGNVDVLDIHKQHARRTFHFYFVSFISLFVYTKMGATFAYSNRRQGRDHVVENREILTAFI